MFEAVVLGASGPRRLASARSFSQLRTELSERADALESARLRVTRRVKEGSRKPVLQVLRLRPGRLEAEVTGCKDEVQEQLANHSS